MRILCVHGVGNHRDDPEWTRAWTDAIWRGMAPFAGDREVEFRFFLYDELFAQHPISALDCLIALGKLLRGAAAYTFSQLLGARGLMRGQIADRLRWTAGMIVQWLENDVLRAQTRAALARALRTTQADVIVAHSLGSLIAYDTLRAAATAPAGQGRTLVTLGSQLGNPFVAGQFGGRIETLPQLDYWYQLYNPHDDVFVAHLPLSAANFAEVDTPFDIPGLADHAAPDYLGHPAAGMRVWRPLLQPFRFTIPDLARAAPLRPRGTRGTTEPGARRALLVGIDRYADPAWNLNGCSNDVALVNELLQWGRFPARSIRLLHNERATAAAIRAHLIWLFEDARDGDVRVLFYSGHGARIPDYGADETVDHLDESLVPHDFDWTPATSVVDDDVYELYSQIPYGCRVALVFDCCHSGGMARSSVSGVRGLGLPEDLLHRSQEFDPERAAWVPRDLPAATKDRRQLRFFGADGVSRRLGRATELRVTAGARRNRLRKVFGHHGPYLPLILQACREDELAMETLVGRRPHGAFTAALGDLLREGPAALPLHRLESGLGRAIRAYSRTQHPQALFPSARANLDLRSLLTPAT